MPTDIIGPVRRTGREPPAEALERPLAGIDPTDAVVSALVGIRLGGDRDEDDKELEEDLEDDDDEDDDEDPDDDEDDDDPDEDEEDLEGDEDEEEE